MKGPTLSSAGNAGTQAKREVSVIGDPIADLRSPSGSLLSVYVDRPSPGGFAAILADLVKPLRAKAESMERRVQKSVRDDADRIRQLAGRLELDSAPGYAIFASSLDGIFMFEPLGHDTQNVAVLGPRPYLRPLRAAPRPVRSGIVVADRALARTFTGFEGVVTETGAPLEAMIGKSNYAGFAGYEEAGVRARADAETARLWKEMSARLLDSHLAQPFDYVAIGGHGETVEEIGRSLHPYLARLPRVTFVSNPQDVSPSALRSEVLVHDVDVRRHRQGALAGRVCDTAWSGGNAVLGLNAALEAANAQAIETMVVAGQFTRSGVMCSNCGHLGRTGTTCPVCGNTMFGVDDVVAAAMDATVAAGGRVFQISVASPLDVDGVGALTRFAVPT